MYRIALTDASGNPTSTWFDQDRAEKFKESTHWDGSNHISDATGSQWRHEMLYRTASGRYILHTYSQWQGSVDTYREIPEAQAIEWLIAQGEEDAVPQEEVDAHEVGAGTTPQRTVRIADDLWRRVQDRAREEGTDASELIRRLLGEYVG